MRRPIQAAPRLRLSAEHPLDELHGEEDRDGDANHRQENRQRGGDDTRHISRDGGKRSGKSSSYSFHTSHSCRAIEKQRNRQLHSLLSHIIHLCINLIAVQTNQEIQYEIAITARPTTAPLQPIVIRSARSDSLIYVI